MWDLQAQFYNRFYNWRTIVKEFTPPIDENKYALLVAATPNGKAIGNIYIYISHFNIYIYISLHQKILQHNDFFFLSIEISSSTVTTKKSEVIFEKEPYSFRALSQK